MLLEISLNILQTNQELHKLIPTLFCQLSSAEFKYNSSWYSHRTEIWMVEYGIDDNNSLGLERRQAMIQTLSFIIYINILYLATLSTFSLFMGEVEVTVLIRSQNAHCVDMPLLDFLQYFLFLQFTYYIVKKQPKLHPLHDCISNYKH